MTAKGSKNSPYIIAWVDSLRLSRSFPVDVYVVTQRVEVIATRRVLFLYKRFTKLGGLPGTISIKKSDILPHRP